MPGSTTTRSALPLRHIPVLLTGLPKAYIILFPFLSHFLVTGTSCTIDFSWVVGRNHKKKRWIVTCWPLVQYVLCYFSLQCWSLDLVPFFLCERGEQCSAFLCNYLNLYAETPSIPPLQFNKCSVIHLFSLLTVWDLQAGGLTRCDYHCTSPTHAYTHTQSTSAGLRDNTANV